MNTNASALIVPPAAPVPDTATNDIRGLKPPVALPNSWGWVAWLLVLLVLAALAAWAWRLWRQKTSQTERLPVIPPHVRAKQKLQQALNLLSRPKEFCTLVSDTIRCYLEERFKFHAPERTTEEFLFELQDTDLLSPDQKQSLGEFLQSCDLVKFARFEPTETALHELHESACRLVDETQFDPLDVSTPTPTLTQASPKSNPGPVSSPNESRHSPDSPLT